MPKKKVVESVIPAPTAPTVDGAQDTQAAENPLAEAADNAEAKGTTPLGTKTNGDIFKMERERREELDDEDAVVIAARIHSRL